MFSLLAKRTVCCLMAALLLLAAPCAVYAEPDTFGENPSDQELEVLTPDVPAADDGEIPEYTTYYDKHKDNPRPEATIEVDAAAVIAEGDVAPEFIEDAEQGRVVQLEENGSAVSFAVSVPETGLYNLKVLYKQVGEENVSAAWMDVLLDDALPCYAMSGIKLPRYWTITEVVKDSRGNEMSHEQGQVAAWRWHTAHDSAGRHNDPLLFMLEAGEHTVTLRFEKAGLQIAGLSFYQEKQAPAYKKPEGVKVSDADYIKAEGERYTWVSDSAIQVTADSNNPAMSPADPELRLYNAIGGSTFATNQQKIGWDINVKKTGWYRIAFKVRQSVKTGSFSTRALRIDGELPYAECAELRFGYNTSWYNKVVTVDGTDDGEAMLFYLEEGVHTLSLEAVPGKLSDAMVALQGCVDDLNSIMRQVNRVVGSSNDQFRDYNLKDEIPTLPDEVKALLTRLVEQQKQIQALSGEGSQTASLQTMITQMENFAKDIDEMALGLASFKNNITALASWVNELMTQPLELDYVVVYGDEEDLPDTSAGFFSDLWFTAQRLFVTFSADYGQLGDVDTSKEYLKVWISTGQEQMQIVQSLANEYSTMEGVDVGVKVELVSANLLEAVMAGKGPDISLQQANDVPVNLAARGELVDLTQFADFDEIRDRYHSNSFIPYTYKRDGRNGIFGIPLTESFSVMFVRTDIFKEMGLEIPRTWDELYEIATILQRSNLGVGIPADMSIFTTMMYQNGGQFFKDDLSATALGSQQGVDAFKAWTSLYTEKGFDLAYDLFNRFRTGEMPIGLGSYALYNQLKVSAPEINGRWEMLPVVGTPQYNADGTPVLDENGEQVIDRSWSSAAQGSVGLNQGSTCTFILKGCEERGLADEAWKFLKWYTSDDARVEFALKIEMRMGVASRYTPANYKAMERLPWTDAERELLLEQWDNMVLFPEVPGSYYVGRNLTYAFRQVVYNSENPVYSLNKYNDIINRELTRKLVAIKKKEA